MKSANQGIAVQGRFGRAVDTSLPLKVVPPSSNRWRAFPGFAGKVHPIYFAHPDKYGFRVPLIVVSPFAKPGYVSHVTHDFGSILKFIEKVYNLPSLGFADAPADDLSDCFDFNQTPLTFQTIAAHFDASHFLQDTRPPTDPDDD
jgi:phospholipase C